jgi:hypothetical protein
MIPVTVAQVVSRALARNPHDRFPDMMRFALAFEQAWNGTPDAIKQNIAESSPEPPVIPPQLSFKDAYKQLSFPPAHNEVELLSFPPARNEAIAISDKHQTILEQPSSQQNIARPTSQQNIARPTSQDDIPVSEQLTVRSDSRPANHRQKYLITSLIAVVASILILSSVAAFSIFHPFSTAMSTKTPQVVLTSHTTPPVKAKRTPHVRATPKTPSNNTNTMTSSATRQPTRIPVPGSGPFSTPTPIMTSPPIPTPTPQAPQKATTSYEAESPLNTRSSSLEEFSCSLCSGGERIGWIYGSATLRFNDIQINQSGDYTVRVYYYNSVPNRVTQLFISVNDGANIEVPGIQVATGNCCNYAPYMASVVITLPAGNNNLTLSNPNGPAPDIDRIIVGP